MSDEQLQQSGGENRGVIPLHGSREYVFLGLGLVGVEVLEKIDNVGLDQPLPPAYTKPERFLQEMVESLQVGRRVGKAGSPTYQPQRSRNLHAIAREIVRKRHWYLIPEMYDVLERDYGGSPYSSVAHNLELPSLYLLTCPDDRFLVSTQGQNVWREINMDQYEPDERGQVWSTVAQYMAPIVGHIHPENADLIPDRFLVHEKFNDVQLPQPAEPMEKTLERAFFHQRYIVNPDGVEVRFQHAGDLQSMRLRVTGNQIMARVQLNGGETFVLLDLDTAAHYSPEVIFNTKTGDPRLAHLLAEVYHDLVTAVTIRGPRRPPRDERAQTNDEEKQERTWRYIPRTIRQFLDEETRVPLDTSRRPPQPHPVVGYVRRGNMTESQRDNIVAFEAEYGVRIMHLVPDGFTFVRPHISPRGYTGEMFESLPVFIKRRFRSHVEELVREAAARTSVSDE